MIAGIIINIVTVIVAFVFGWSSGSGLALRNLKKRLPCPKDGDTSLQYYCEIQIYFLENGIY
ncbi:MAG: hypothetical protein WCW93_03885 [Candidatus Paceibacterota bacterium]|jgi:hypothetical protein